MTDEPTAPSPSGTDPEILARLTELEAASDERRRELRAVLDDLPATLSRRRLVASMIDDVRRAPARRAPARRALEAMDRATRWAMDRARRRVRGTG